jgi:GABA permease
VKVTERGVPRAAILLSSVVGFLCVIAAAVSPDTVFLFLLNSSGAIILFVYLLIAISQIVLRRRSGSAGLKVKMWLFPGLSIVTVVGILAVLAQMALDPEIRPQLVLSLVAWAVVLVLYVVTKARGGSVDPVAEVDEPETAVPAARDA